MRESTIARIFGATAVLGSFLWLAAPAAAQQVPLPPAEGGQGVPKLEASLDAVRPNERVEVLTTSRLRFRGRLVDVSDTVLTIETERRTRNMPAAEVAAVWRPASRHLQRNLVLGASIGAGLGGLAWAGQGDCNDPTSLCATDGATTAGDVFMLAGLGAGIGAVSSYLHPGHADPVYFADRPGSSTRGWEPLEGRVYPGEWLEVRRHDTGKTEKGHLAAFDEKGVTLFAEPVPRTIPVEAIERVSSEKPSWWRVPATVGIAGFYGAILGAVACGDSDNCIGAIAGSVAVLYGTIGTYTMIQLRRQAVLYDARRSGLSRQTMIVPVFQRRGVGVRCQVRF